MSRSVSASGDSRTNDSLHRIPHKPQTSWEDCEFEPLESTGNFEI